jgi:protein SEY1
MGLLKTVLEVNLGLFGKKAVDGCASPSLLPNSDSLASPPSTKNRTLLLFVIRDHIGTTPLTNLQATLAADIQKIWDSLSKPPELASVQLSDYFDLAFEALPHKILAAQNFEEEVRRLRTRFVDPSAEGGYLFKTTYHKRIPADGVALYMSNIWDQVQSNKDLDLPTQQELLAQFRCDEIAGVAVKEVGEGVRAVRREVEGGRVVDGLGASMREWRGIALGESGRLVLLILGNVLIGFGAERYDRDASRYHQGVYKRKRQDLLTTIDTLLSPLFLSQLKNLHKSCLVRFKKEMQDGLKGEEYNFAEVVRLARGRCEGRFREGAEEAVVVEAGEVEEGGAEWSWEEEMELLREEIGVVADVCRRDETKKMVNRIEVRSDFFSFFLEVELTCLCCCCTVYSGISRNRSQSLLS